VARNKSTIDGVLKMRSLTLLIVLIVFAFIGDGPIRPGNKSLNTSQITLGIDSLLILIPHNGHLYKVGSLVLNTDLVDDNGERVLRRVEHATHDDTLVSVDSFMVAQNTLLPLYQRSLDSKGTHKLDLSDMTEPEFYDNSMDLILASLPLSSGYKAKLALIGENAELIAYIQVVGKVSIKTVDGLKCNSWEIRVDAGEDSGTYWLSDRSRILIRYVTTAQNMIIARIRGCPVSI